MTAAPRKAFVLAAGFGTRMLPLTKTVPKPLLPLWGKPLIVHTLEMLRDWGVREVCINLHHLPQVITDYLAKHPVRGLDVGFSREDKALGTGGALPHARWFVERAWSDGGSPSPDGGPPSLHTEPFWMLNADVAMRLNPEPLIRAFKKSGIAACWLTGSAGPRTVEMSRGVISEFKSSRPKIAGTYTFCGLQLLSPRILEFLPADGFATIVEGYQATMRAGHKIAGVEIDGSFWADLGTPKQYLDAHAAWKNRKRFVSAARDAIVAKGATVENSVIWSGARIGPKAVVRDAIVGCGCKVDGRASGIVMRAGDALAPAEIGLLKKCGWSENATAILLGPRGSARAFTRVRDGKRSGILIHYDPSRVENPLYVGHAKFLEAAGFPVPKIIGDDPKRCVTLLEDLGDDSILVKHHGAAEAVLERVYRATLDSVLVLHGEASRRARKRRLHMVPSFRPRLYQWERDYFAEHMLQKRLGLPPSTIAPIKNDLKKIGVKLFHAPLVVVHRDLQSSNVILKNGKPVFIDFQGMRWGPAAYDLASLLADPYMELSEPLQLRLLDYYAARCGDETVRDMFWLAVIQRLAQALGAFAKLGATKGTEGFANHIPAALRMMRRALSHVKGLPNLRAWVESQSR